MEEIYLKCYWSIVFSPVKKITSRKIGVVSLMLYLWSSYTIPGSDIFMISRAVRTVHI